MRTFGDIQESDDKPLSKSKFYSRYSQHVDLHHRVDGKGAERHAAITSGGWAGGHAVNTLPAYQGGKPTNVVDAKLAPRKGDYVYLVHKDHTVKAGGPHRLAIAQGWKPKPHEAFQVDSDHPSMHDEYMKRHGK